MQNKGVYGRVREYYTFAIWNRVGESGGWIKIDKNLHWFRHIPIHIAKFPFQMEIAVSNGTSTDVLQIATLGFQMENQAAVSNGDWGFKWRWVKGVGWFQMGMKILLDKWIGRCDIIFKQKRYHAKSIIKYCLHNVSTV